MNALYFKEVILMKKFVFLFAAAILILTSISAFAGDGTKDSPLKIGVTEGPHAEILEFLQPLAEKEGVFYKLLVFDNYNIPNEALNAGDLDANAFQHRPFLDAQIKAHGYKIVPIHDNILCPIGLFSKKVKNLSDLQEGASIAIPNDPSNGGRSLLLLQKLGLVVLKDGVGITPSPLDIVENSKKLKIVELEAAQTPRALDDVDAAFVNDNYAIPAGLKLSRDAIAAEGTDSPYTNVFAVREEDKEKPVFQKLIALYENEDVKRFIEKKYDGAIIPAW